jgi:hypothetical protein
VDGHGQQREQHADAQGREHAVSENALRTDEILRPATVCDLHAEAGRGGIAEAPEDPGRAADQADGGSLLGAEPAHHRSVDVAHQAHRQLGHDGRPCKQEGELELLTPAHRRASAEPRQ